MMSSHWLWTGIANFRRRFVFFAAVAALALSGLGISQVQAASGNGLPSAKDRVLVFAAASLTDAVNEVVAAYAAAGHEKPLVSYDASSALARQIENGAPANIFISADEAWMDYLAQRHLIDAASRVSFLGNKLVLIAPLESPLKLDISYGFPLAQALGDGHLAMGNPASVPVGKYGKAALENLGVWNSVAAHVVRAESVRAALFFVERGEARAGIVYLTDAKISKKVSVVAEFPQASYPEVSYPMALVAKNETPAARDFRAFVLSDKAKAIFRKYGFIIK